jgi:hypothetical protein
MKQTVLVLAILLMAATAFAADCTRFKTGDTISLSTQSNVYKEASSGIVGKQPAGAYGLITAGPISKAYGMRPYCWYQVDYKSGVDGWTFDQYFVKTNSIPQIQAISCLQDLVLTGNVPVMVSASDTDGIEKLYVHVDNKEASILPLTAPLHTGSFTLMLNTAAFPNGPHVVTVYVYNAHGSTSHSWTVDFIN